jgi:hypothetical protein
LGMEVEQSRDKIRLHLSNYIWEPLDEFKAFQKKLLQEMLFLKNQRLVPDKDDCPILPDPRKQKSYQSIVANL